MCDLYALKLRFFALGTCVHIMGYSFLNFQLDEVFHIFSPDGAGL